MPFVQNFVMEVSKFFAVWAALELIYGQGTVVCDGSGCSGYW